MDFCCKVVVHFNFLFLRGFAVLLRPGYIYRNILISAHVRVVYKKKK